MDGVIEIDIDATAEAVHAPVPDKTVQVVDTVGLTFTVAVDGGFVPLLAVQVNGPAPLDANVTVSPTQMVVLDGVIFIDKVGDIDTLATAETVQAPVPDITL